jgi:hypothetical protein
MVLWFFAILAFAGFCISVIAHFATFVNAPGAQMSHVWPLHVGIFVVFIPMLLAQNRLQAKRPARPRMLLDFFPNVPPLFRFAIRICVAYTIVYFILFMVFQGVREHRDGYIEDRNGRHVLVKDRQVVREVPEQEYRDNQLRVARGFSGHWMLFYLMSAVGLYDFLLSEESMSTRPVVVRMGQVIQSPWKSFEAKDQDRRIS